MTADAIVVMTNMDHNNEVLGEHGTLVVFLEENIQGFPKQNTAVDSDLTNKTERGRDIIGHFVQLRTPKFNGHHQVAFL